MFEFKKNSSHYIKKLPIKINIAREKLQMPYKVQRNKNFYTLAKKELAQSLHTR